MNQQTTYIVAYAGPSGAGKSVMADLMVSQDKDFYKLHQMTTREPRHNKDEYVFVPPVILDVFKGNGLITCYTEFNGNKYGTLIEKTPFKFLETVVSAEGMTSLYHDIEKFEKLLNTKVEILPVLISYEVTEESLAERKRNRAVEFVQNEINQLEQLKIDIENFDWFLTIDNSTGYTSVEDFQKAFYKAFENKDLSNLSSFIQATLENPNIPVETLLKIKLLLTESKLESINTELDEFVLNEPLPEPEVVTDSETFHNEVANFVESEIVTEPVMDAIDLTEPEKLEALNNVIPEESDDDIDAELLANVSAMEQVKAQQEVETQEQQKVAEELAQPVSMNDVGYKRISRMCKNGFIDYLSTTGRNRSAVLLDNNEMENAMINFLVTEANINREELNLAGIIRLETVNANDAVKYAFYVNMNGNEVPIHTMTFDTVHKQINN